MNLKKITDTIESLDYEDAVDAQDRIEDVSNQDKLLALRQLYNEVKEANIKASDACSILTELVGGEWTPIDEYSFKGKVGDINIYNFEDVEPELLPLIIEGHEPDIDYEVDLPEDIEDRLDISYYNSSRDALCKANEDITFYEHEGYSASPYEMYIVPGNYSDGDNTAIFIPKDHYFRIDGEASEVEDYGTNFDVATGKFVEYFES